MVEWSVSKLTALEYNPESPLFTLDTEYLADSGLAQRKLVLYCRPTFHDQFKFLQKRVLDEGILGWIIGPPGTGKSATALSFASCLDRNKWTITWIHLSRNKNSVCIRMEGDYKKVRVFKYYELDEYFPKIKTQKTLFSLTGLSV
jgi:hypothetical protein